MSIVCSAFADTDTLPGKQEATIEDYLGDWYLQTVCFEGECMPLTGLTNGVVMVLGEDNTISFSGETVMDEEGMPQRWEFSGHTATVFSKDTETGEEVEIPLVIDEEGNLNLAADGAVLKCTREANIAWGTGDVKEDAVIEDFAGEWKLYSMGDEEMSIPVAMLGLEANMTIDEEGKLAIDLFGAKDENVDYTLADGMISGVFANEEIGANSKFTAQYHVEGSVVMTLLDETEEGTSESKLIFIRPDKMPEVNFGDMIGAALELEEAAPAK